MSHQCLAFKKANSETVPTLNHLPARELESRCTQWLRHSHTVAGQNYKSPEFPGYDITTFMALDKLVNIFLIN